MAVPCRRLMAIPLYVKAVCASVCARPMLEFMCDQTAHRCLALLAGSFRCRATMAGSMTHRLADLPLSRRCVRSGRKMCGARCRPLLAARCVGSSAKKPMLERAMASRLTMPCHHADTACQGGRTLMVGSSGR
ncbi:hypothetical protein OAO87_02615 [bacterium]|nr:hypothetical protein [bacterium]